MDSIIESTDLSHGYSQTDKTIFTFVDETGEKSTLTLDKFVADTLPRYVGDVHAWIQIQYDGIITGKINLARYIKVLKKRGEMHSRRTIGDIIRLIAMSLVINSIDDAEW